MPTGLNARWLQRAVALGTVWFMAEAVNPNQSLIWLAISFVAIVLVLEFLAFRHGIAAGIDMYLNMTPEQRKNIEKIIKGEQS